MSKLIIIRGNSGSGKSSAAVKLQKKLGHGTMLISQDVIRREVLYVKDGPQTPAASLILELARYGKANCDIVIIEGIFKASWYGEMFESLVEEFREDIYGYYYNVSFEETLRRHKYKPNCHEFGEEEMRRWWNENDLLESIPEKIIEEECLLEDTVEKIYKDVMEGEGILR